jgi:hypothetical protein
MLLHAFDIAAFESDYAKSIPKHDKLTIPANGNGIRAEKGLGCTVLDQVSAQTHCQPSCIKEKCIGSSAVSRSRSPCNRASG